MRSSSITLFAILAFTSSVFAVPAGPVAPQPSAVQVNTNAGVNVGWCTYRREGVTTQCMAAPKGPALDKTANHAAEAMATTFALEHRNRRGTRRRWGSHGWMWGGLSWRLLLGRFDSTLEKSRKLDARAEVQPRRDLAELAGPAAVSRLN
ncbi:hypothetical protein MBM_09420 [Drepanopeziza brunnea f. sp. 'multigermtubi' MB_m1]|uniref:Uncharacterized protein n=1 Tax=Marssonina brunnea f. sp. multigermtubi (strain MB_m1) TaxID=1072389 RepID=K1WHN7_MARBU|nr:uncharacterized protein MBM_09420 [Drepanopeziza brunnea f. sp. 'multigermtubi' MB_m1]EKD12386.1 hypothetical protein MBM_09420 [Drepanopeziza brunnea f. sp. 'multigermtubi' MB_m1]